MGKAIASDGMIFMRATQLFSYRPTTMGFADISIAEIAADYHLSIEQVFDLCQQLGIAYKTQSTRLPLEDAKAVISTILSQKSQSVSS
jgi:hypothetical protein